MTQVAADIIVARSGEAATQAGDRGRNSDVNIDLPGRRRPVLGGGCAVRLPTGPLGQRALQRIHMPVERGVISCAPDLIVLA